MNQRHWQDAVNIVLGLWIFASAASFIRHAMADATLWHMTGGAWPPQALGIALMWSLAISGVVITFVAFFAWRAFRTWQEWINIGFGILLSGSPWVLGFPASVELRWNVVITGAAVAGLAAWVLTLERAAKPTVR